MRRQGWWTRYASVRLIIAAVAVLIAGVVQAMDKFAIKTSWKWVHDNDFIFWTVVVAGSAVLINTVGDVIMQRRALAGESRRVDIHKAVIAALVTISEETKVKITDLGANVFLVKKTRRKEIRVGSKTRHIGRRPRLERIERIRLADYPAMSAVKWTEGKGVIGDCWKNARPEHVHWAPIARRWAGKNITDTQWEQKVKPEDKAGFSRGDFMTMVGKYAEIRAVPIKSGQGKVIGVIAVDRVWRPADRQDAVLNGAGVEDTITGAASVLHNVLGGR